jgi:hypothetical protein
MYYQLVLLGLVCLAAPCFVRDGGYESRHKPFELVGVSGIFFLLGASFGLGMSTVDYLQNNVSMLNLARGLMAISFILGWIGLIIGAIWSTVEILREREPFVARRIETSKI